MGAGRGAGGLRGDAAAQHGAERPRHGAKRPRHERLLRQRRGFAARGARACNELPFVSGGVCLVVRIPCSLLPSSAVLREETESQTTAHWSIQKEHVSPGSRWDLQPRPWGTSGFPSSWWPGGLRIPGLGVGSWESQSWAHPRSPDWFRRCGEPTSKPGAPEPPVTPGQIVSPPAARGDLGGGLTALLPSSSRGAARSRRRPRPRARRRRGPRRGARCRSRPRGGRYLSPGPPSPPPRLCGARGLLAEGPSLPCPQEW